MRSLVWDIHSVWTSRLPASEPDGQEGSPACHQLPLSTGHCLLILSNSSRVLRHCLLPWVLLTSLDDKWASERAEVEPVRMERQVVGIVRNRQQTASLVLPVLMN